MIGTYDGDSSDLFRASESYSASVAVVFSRQGADVVFLEFEFAGSAYGHGLWTGLG